MAGFRPHFTQNKMDHNDVTVKSSTHGTIKFLPKGARAEFSPNLKLNKNRMHA